MNDSWLKVKVGDADEIDSRDITPGLIFMGDDISPSITNNYQQNTGMDGSLFTSAIYNKNTVNAKFAFMFNSWNEFRLKKHAIYKVFMQKSLMRIRTNVDPYLVKYVRAAQFDIAPLENGSSYAVFTIPFENPSGYNYSLLRSDSLYTFDSNGWQFGMNLPMQKLVYTHSESDFKLFNASDIRIDPYYQRHDLIVKVNFSGAGLTITNKTTNSSWSYTKSAIKTDNIILTGISTTLNGDPASANTDYGNLTLDPGWNEITVTGATDFSLTFSFPFIYLE